jgi:hypothetical protein
MKSPKSAIIILALVGAGFTVGSQAAPREKTAGAKTQVVRLNAKPEPIDIDTASTAVIVVDMQNDFGAKSGMFDRAGIDISGIQKVIGPTAKVLASARRAGVKIIYLKMGFRPDLSDLQLREKFSKVIIPFSQKRPRGIFPLTADRFVLSDC